MATKLAATCTVHVVTLAPYLDDVWKSLVYMYVHVRSYMYVSNDYVYVPRPSERKPFDGYFAIAKVASFDMYCIVDLLYYM